MIPGVVAYCRAAHPFVGGAHNERNEPPSGAERRRQGADAAASAAAGRAQGRWTLQGHHGAGCCPTQRSRNQWAKGLWCGPLFVADTSNERMHCAHQGRWRAR